jgi:IMP dehydrogenase/GMP reductase
MLDERITDGLTFDDVLIIPAKSKVLPRDVDLTTHLSSIELSEILQASRAPSAP